MKHFSSVMLRTIVALLCLSCLSLTVVAALLTHAMVDEQRLTNKRQIEKIMDSLTELLDETFYDYFGLATEVTTLPELRPVSLSSDDTLAQLDAMELLQTLKNVDREIIDVLLYIRDGDFFITGASVYRADSFVNTYYSFSNMDSLEVYELFRNPGSVLNDSFTALGFIPMGRLTHFSSDAYERDALLILVTLPQWSKTPYEVLGIFVQTDTMRKQLSMAAGEGGARILDANGATLVSVGEENLTNGFERDDSVHVFRRTSNRFGLQYEVHIPDSILRRTNIDLMNMLIPVAILGVMVCLGTPFCAKWANQPIRQLVANIGGGKQKFPQDESGYIRKYIYELSKRVEQNELYVDELLVRRLLAGKQLNESEHTRCERFLQKDYAHCSVMLALLTQRPEQMLSLTSLPCEHALVHIMQEAQPDTLVCIVASDETDDGLLRQVKSMQASYPLSEASVIAIGPVDDDLMQLHESLKQAENLLNEMRYQGRTGIEVAAWHDVWRAAYPVEPMQHLKLALQANDAQQLRLGYSEICAALMDSAMSPETGAIVVYDLTQLFPQLSGYVYATAQDFCTALHDCVERIAASYPDMKDNATAATETEELKRNVADMIEKLLEEPGFGISLISQRFGMSDSSFSHMFKRTFGINFITYVNRKKIQRAKVLLNDTNIGLDAIASRLGYSSASNFTRMFKTYEGLTPGAYRQMLRNAVVIDDKDTNDGI